MGSTGLSLLWICVVLLGLLGCAASGDRVAHEWIAEMDARAPEDRVPNWDVIRGLMTRAAPSVGEPAPDFTLDTDDGSATVSLSSFRDKLPVVLIFGSWT